MAKAKKKHTVPTRCTIVAKITKANTTAEGPGDHDVAKLTIKLPSRPHFVGAAEQVSTLLSPLLKPPEPPNITMKPEDQANMLPVASALTPRSWTNGLQTTSTPRIKHVLAPSLTWAWSPEILFVNHTLLSFSRKRSQKVTKDPISTNVDLPAKKPRMGVVGTSAAMCKPHSESADGKESEEEARDFTIHVQVYETTTEKKSGQGSKSSMTTTVVSKGPFKFNTIHTFACFKMQVSSTLSCDFRALPVWQFEWKFKGQPQSAPCKNLGNMAGFKALVAAIKVKHATENVIIWLYTPKLSSGKSEDARSKKAQHSLSGDNRGRNALSGNKTHISGLKTMKVNAEQEITLDKYPVGNFKLFPDMRVWKDEHWHGNHFQLTNTFGKADLSTPLTSHHFTKGKCLQISKAGTQDSDVGAIVDAANGPLPVQYYPTMHPPADYAPSLSPAYRYPPYYLHLAHPCPFKLSLVLFHLGILSPLAHWIPGFHIISPDY